jgi:copper chaperone CopZ
LILKLMYIAGAALTGAALVCPLCLDASGSKVAPHDALITSATMNAAADTARAKLTIRGMTCGSCATTARIALERSEGVYRARVSYDSASAVVVYDPEKTSPPAFIAELKKLTGYEAVVARVSSKGAKL